MSELGVLIASVDAVAQWSSQGWEWLGTSPTNLHVYCATNLCTFPRENYIIDCMYNT